MKKNQNQIRFSRTLRRHQTEAEKLLWSKLRNGQQNSKYRRQHPIGPYIVDFVNLDHKLIIEIDGSQHDENKDAARTILLQANRYKVLRFWDNEVLNNVNGVLEEIEKILKVEESPSP